MPDTAKCYNYGSPVLYLFICISATLNFMERGNREATPPNFGEVKKLPLRLICHCGGTLAPRQCGSKNIFNFKHIDNSFEVMGALRTLQYLAERSAIYMPGNKWVIKPLGPESCAIRCCCLLYSRLLSDAGTHMGVLSSSWPAHENRPF